MELDTFSATKRYGSRCCDMSAVLPLANFMRTLALPEAVKKWSLTSLREKLVKIGAKIVRRGLSLIKTSKAKEILEFLRHSEF